MLGVISDHEEVGSQAGQPPRVLPVVHDNFEVDEHVVRECFRRAEGHLYTVDPSESELKGAPTANLIAVVESTAQAAGIDLAVVSTDGLVSIASDPGLKQNDSSNILVSALARLLSSEIGEFPLVGLAYEASSLDATRKSLLWQVLVNLAPAHLPSSIKTFVPLEIGPIDHGRHCAGAPSVRYAVVDGESRKRALEEGYVDGRISGIVTTLDRPLVLFLGAGASASARIPVGDTVRDAAIRRVVGPAASDAAEAFRVWVYDNNRFLSDESGLPPEQFSARLTLERVLREEFKGIEEQGKTRSESETVQELQRACEEALEWEPPGREALHKLLELHPRVILVTVNFDRQVEEGLTVEHEVYASQDEFAGAAAHVTARCKGDDERVPILKVHGSIERPDTLIADVNDTEMGLPTAVTTALEAIFEVVDEPVNWMWVGCSMRDIDVTQWMRRKTKEDIYDLWVDALPGRTIFDFIDECRPELRGNVQSRIVTELPDVFLPKLAAHIENLTTN